MMASVIDFPIPHNKELAEMAYAMQKFVHAQNQFNAKMLDAVSSLHDRVSDLEQVSANLL